MLQNVISVLQTITPPVRECGCFIYCQPGHAVEKQSSGWWFEYSDVTWACSGTCKRYSNRKETSCVHLLNAGFEPGVPDTKSLADWMLADKPTELSRIKDQAKKTWIRQPVPMISEHSTHLTLLSVDFRTWLWRYTYLLLLISMIWHRQAIFKSKGEKLCSSAESRIWTQDPRHQIASRLNARLKTDWAIEDQAKKLELDSLPLWSASIQPTWPHCQLTFAPGSGNIHICCC